MSGTRVKVQVLEQKMLLVLLPRRKCLGFWYSVPEVGKKIKYLFLIISHNITRGFLLCGGVSVPSLLVRTPVIGFRILPNP